MPDFRKVTGQSGAMLIRDDGSNFVDLFFENSTGNAIPEVPWTYTLNGRKESLRNLSIEDGVKLKHAIQLFVGTAQTIIFHLGESGSTELGGPTDLSAYIQRGSLQGTVNITVGAGTRKAIPYVNVNGVWRIAEPYSRFEGNWTQTT